ncbi:phage portal protein, HK97 family [Stappia sp. 22II-S9-Z10]|nr:phage portal protein, HK97 family [Stappia sp. 22II-S9-Z10]
MLNRLLQRFERRAMGADLLPLFGAQPTAAGVTVTAETALRSPTTLAAVRAISETLGAVPLHLYERGANGERSRSTAHPAAAILAGDWCPWCGGIETRTAMQMDALLPGAGYALVVRIGGRVVELHRIDPRHVTVDLDGSEPRFKVREDGIERTVDWRDILRIATPGSTLDRPVNLTNLAREAIALDILMADHQARLFSSGARPSGILKYDRAINPEQVARIREGFSTIYGGNNSGRTAILEKGIEFDALQFSSVDSQFLELRRLVTQEIARAFKVPGTLIGDLERATWRNVEELNRQFVTMTLLPWAEVWQGALERLLLASDERAAFFVEAKFDDLLRGDLAGRFAAYREASGGAWLTPNEVRALENRPPIEGGDELIRQAGQEEATAPMEGADDER